MEIEMTGIQKAIDIVGGANALAAKLGVSHQAVYVWLRKGWVPAQRAIEIEKLFDIPRVELFKPELAALFASN
jgi:DNA-binding transcriptional regulator YdaS (Cro superfamily)